MWRSQTADISAPGGAAGAIAARPDVIFHLAAIVSGEAEADFEKGYRINLDGTREIFEAVRHEGMKSPYRPAAGLRLLHRRLRRTLPGGDRRRVLHHPAHQLWHAEGDRGAASGRLFTARLLRRHRASPAHHLHPAGQAEQGGLGLLLQHPARAALGPRGRAAGGGDRPSFPCQPPRRHQLPAAGGDHGSRPAGRPPNPLHAGPLGDGAASRSTRCAGWRGRMR